MKFIAVGTTKNTMIITKAGTRKTSGWLAEPRPRRAGRLLASPPVEGPGAVGDRGDSVVVGTLLTSARSYAGSEPGRALGLGQLCELGLSGRRDLLRRLLAVQHVNQVQVEIRVGHGQRLERADAVGQRLVLVLGQGRDRGRGRHRGLQ